jgi:hypothetical protein
MTTGADMPGFAEAFGLGKDNQASDFSVQEIAIQTSLRGATGSSMVNVLLPGETAAVTLHFINKRDQPLRASGVVQVIRYGTSVPVGEESI